jgi:hypothetical protein
MAVTAVPLISIQHIIKHAHKYTLMQNVTSVKHLTLLTEKWGAIGRKCHTFSSQELWPLDHRGGHRPMQSVTKCADIHPCLEWGSNPGSEWWGLYKTAPNLGRVPTEIPLMQFVLTSLAISNVYWDCSAGTCLQGRCSSSFTQRRDIGPSRVETRCNSVVGNTRDHPNTSSLFQAVSRERGFWNVGDSISAHVL